MRVWLLLCQYVCLLFVFVVWLLTFSSLLNNSGERGYPCHVPDLSGKAFNFSPLRMVLAVGFSYIAFMILRYAPSIPTWWRVFIKKGCFFYSYWEDHMILVLSFIYVVYHIDWFVGVEPPLQSGINLTWSWWIILLMSCWILLGSIFMRTFASTFIRNSFCNSPF